MLSNEKKTGHLLKMKVIFTCASPRSVIVWENDQVIQKDLPSFLPSPEVLKRVLPKATIAFYEPFVPMFPLVKIDPNYFKDTTYLATIQELSDFAPDSDEETIFIDCSGCRSIPEFMRYYNRTFAPNELYVFVNPRKHGPRTDLTNIDSEPREYDLEKIVALEYDGFCGCFDPFTTPRLMTDTWSPIEREHNIDFLLQLAKIAESYVKLGFLEGLINPEANVPNWVCNINITPIRTLCSYFGIKSPSEYRKDIPIDDFMEKQDYRQLIAEYVCKVVAHIGVKNNFIPPNSKWNSPKTYSQVYLKLSGLK